jgi:sucrose-6-phosphate hydrolase SacC (GH32 family)
MAGSEMFKRTRQEQPDFPVATASGSTPVQIAITYHDREVTLCSNGVRCASYTIPAAERFGSDSRVLMGLRHTGAAPENRFFTGSIDDARIYATALTPEQLAALRPNTPSDPAPLAWWDFEAGNAADRQGTFGAVTLFGGARVADGRLNLDQPGACLAASRDPLDTALTGGADADLNAAVRSLRERFAADPLRAGYHFVIPEGTGMPFDPNGAIFWKGRYHLFYIFQDRRGHNWGHVSSTDLFHWRHHPTGLTAGMFSGNCFLNAEGRPTMCYHQVGQGNAMAVALDDDLNEWRKLDSNPITPATTPGDPHHDRYRSWDPYGWLEGGTYYAIFGGETPGVARADSLAGKWTYVGDLMANAVDGVSLHEDVSCPDLFRLGDRHVLLCISHRLGARYYLGEWKGGAFHPTFHERMSWVDNAYFAPESLLDDRGRRILWAWLLDGPGFQTRAAGGWSGTLSLPRVLTLAADGTLRMNPPAELERLRFNPVRLADLTVPAGSETTAPGVSGASLELDLEFDVRGAGRCGVKVCCSPDGTEQTAVYYDATDHRLKIDTTRSGADAGPGSIEAGPFTLKEGELLRLRVFVDQSVVEVFANDGRQAVMRRIYPSRTDSTGVRVFAEGGPARVVRLDAWELMPSNPF